ncbi:hypothetical protein BDY24DRAFT_110173 [Mrakia frigida]|uniref:uncharacterized protein n=1 Tax=Mrakia frigida TaxID=29902 RepID=UPI003FCC267B
MPSRRPSTGPGLSDSALVPPIAPPPSSFNSRGSTDPSQPPSSSTISSAKSSSSKQQGMSQSQTLPRKFGELLRLGNTNGTATRGAGIDPPATAGVDDSFGLGNIVGVGGGKGAASGWTLSVAQDMSSTRGSSKGKGEGRVVLYAATATHNYTLLRTIREMKELHDKLVPLLPGSSLPAFPPNSLPTYSQTTIKAHTPSRRRSFLNAFSRFTSESTSRPPSPGHGLVSPPVSPPSSNHPLNGSSSHFNIGQAALGSPEGETGNPLERLVEDGKEGTAAVKRSITGGKLDEGPHSQMSALSGYLTEVANNERVRETRAWKKFIRVRGDDLSSVRVERKIKRTQSAQALNLRSPPGLHAGKSQSRRYQDRSETTSSSAEDVLGSEGVLIERFEELDDGELDRGPTGDTLSVSTGSLGTRPLPSSPNEKKIKKSSLEQSSSSSRKLFKGRSASSSSNSPNSQTVDLPPTPAATPLKPIVDHSSISSSVDFDDEDATSSASPAAKAKQQPPRPASADPDKSSSKMMSRDRGLWDDSEGGEAVEKRIGGGGRRKREKKKVSIEEFELIRVLGRGCAGKVLLVRQKTSSSSTLMAMKCIVKRHVVAHQEIGHTLTEQAVLKRMSREIQNPFVVHLHHSFHDKENLFLVMDFHPGGDLATQLARWGKFGRDRARFYAAEIVEGVQGLHAAGVIYRDLKPENILLDHAGHLVLTDFGLSKEFPRSATATSPHADGSDTEAVKPTYTQQNGTPMTEQERRDWAPIGGRGKDTTNTFCGTAEYLAPEVIQGLPYSYAVDWWALGTMLFEMLIGITPFYATNHTDMYTRVLHDDLIFPEERPVDQDTKSLIRGLLQRNPALRLSEPRIKKHPYFSMIDWDHVYHKRYIPPYTPPTDPLNETDTQNFDSAFLDMVPSVGGDAETGEGLASTPSAATQAAASRADDRASLFDGYSYRERDAASILLEEDEPLSPVDRASGELMRSSFEQGGFTSNETRRSIDALTSEPTEPSPPNNDSTSTINEESASSNAPSTVDSSSEAISPSVSPELHPSRLPSQQHHRQRSGIPALDRGLPSDIEAEEDEDDEDDDWDLVEKPRDGRGEQNGSRGTTLFARGVVDRYRLGVLKKKESRASGLSGSGMSTPRSVSAATLSTSNSSMTIGNDSSSSPSESRIRRGLTFKSSKFKVRPKPVSSQSYTNTTFNPPPISQAPSASSNPNSSASIVPANLPASYSLPANLATNGHGGNRRSDHSAASSTMASTPERSSSASPTKGLRVVSGSTAGEESDAGGTSSSRMSGQERMKMGKEKMMSLFGVKSSSSSSSSTNQQPPRNPSP